MTRCRSAPCPWPENENLPLLLNASYSPRGHICGLPTRQSGEFHTRQTAIFPVREGRFSFQIRLKSWVGLLRGKFIRNRRPGMRREGSAGYIKRFTAARASAICGSLALEFSKWLRNSW